MRLTADCPEVLPRTFGSDINSAKRKGIMKSRYLLVTIVGLLGLWHPAVGGSREMAGKLPSIGSIPAGADKAREQMNRYRLWNTRHAAELGDVLAQLSLGDRYATGENVYQDYVQAYAWLNLAAAQGNEDAAKNRSRLMRSMTPSQIEEGQRLSREYAEKEKKKKADLATMPRFADQGDGTMIDNMTGLEWVKKPHSLSGNSETMPWRRAIDFCNGLVYAGHSDWRLPSEDELTAINSLKSSVPGAQNGYYWSGSLYGYSTDGAYTFEYLYDPSIHNEAGYVWPVRGGTETN